MATRELYEAYKRARREYFARTLCDLPTWPGAADQALKIARGEARNVERFKRLGIPRFLYGTENEDLDGGLRLVYTVESDDCTEWEDHGAPRLEWSRHRPDCIDNGASDGWIDRDGAAYWHGSRPYEWARVESDYSLADRVRDNRKRMPRGVAYLEARRSLARDLEYWRPFFDGRESWLVVSVELQNEDGDELARDSLSGVESAGDYWRECIADVAENVLAEYRDALRAEIPKARESIAGARDGAHALAAELRALRGMAGRAPRACAVLREKLAEYRRLVSQRVAELRDAREALRAVELATGGAP